jgi:dTDP-4-dehydrorhamnose 3,5-epimerase
MGLSILNKINLTPLKRISVDGGDVLHALKYNEIDFNNFGEAYFSIVNFGVIKAWKKHNRMTLNLIVPIGNVKFVFFSEDLLCRKEIIIGESNYARITVPPGIWFGFQGLDEKLNLLLNIADILHDPTESERATISEFKQLF